MARRTQLKSLRAGAMRPTADRVREAVFGSLGMRVEGGRFLDLYAGAGTVGLEALSRGAAQATFVDSHRPAGRVIEENARRCGFEELVRVIVAPVERGLARLRREGAVFEFVYVDPPYDTGAAGGTMAWLGQWVKMVSGEGIVICEHSRHEEIGEEIGGLMRMRRRRFGETVVDFYQPGSRSGQETTDSSELGGQRIDDGTLRGDV
ncbi:MAG: 16S rRNA (guanine(966)-N(2))-methyltransferase RsmD [Armatimonadetes bacterium]|nr:16S rRNA (guanine(966)-N(2))-methyltransferase RsmD [Armatimonadota bacterium]